MLRYFGDGLAMPGRAILDANLSTTLPRFAWATNRLGTATSGSGLASDGMQRALGEYFERRHFYLEVRGESTGSLEQVQDECLRRSLTKAMHQTASASVRDQVASHPFTLSAVAKLPSFEPVTAPTILFSITGESLGPDGDFFFCRDTTGCAAHFELNRALDGALREFAERQYLLRHWLTARGAKDISGAVCGGLSRAASMLVQKLGRSGDICFLDISCGELAGAIVLAVYRGSRDEHVRYCVGLSCATNAACAADRAVKELWQSYVFLRNMVKKADADALVHDRYHRYFLECNHAATADTMLSGIEAGAPAGPVPPSGGLITSIHARFRHLLAYVRQIDVLSKRLWCVRVISPEAFMHMDNSRHFNLECAYSDAFRPHIVPARLRSMVPFP